MARATRAPAPPVAPPEPLPPPPPRLYAAAEIALSHRLEHGHDPQARGRFVGKPVTNEYVTIEGKEMLESEAVKLAVRIIKISGGGVARFESAF